MGKDAGAPIEPVWSGLQQPFARLAAWGKLSAAGSAALLGAVAALRSPWRMDDASPLSPLAFTAGLLACGGGFLFLARSGQGGSPLEPYLPRFLHACRGAFSARRLGWAAAILWASACTLRQDSFVGLAFGALFTAVLFHFGRIRLTALDMDDAVAELGAEAQAAPVSAATKVAGATANAMHPPVGPPAVPAPHFAARLAEAEADSEGEDLEAAELDEEAAEEAETTPPRAALFHRREGDALIWEGRLRCEFAAGTPTATAHVAFCPPFEGAPQLECHPLSGPPVRIRIGQALPQGARFDLRLATPSSRPETVEWAFFARPAATAAPAAPERSASRAA